MKRSIFPGLLLGFVTLGPVACSSPTPETRAPTAPAAEEAVTAGGVEEKAAATEGWKELVPNARFPLEGVLTGGQPSAQQLEATQSAGFKTVINLRTEGESGTKQVDVEGLGMTYVALPIEGAEGINEENARALATLLDEAKKPVLLHCGSGNRVGALLALKAHFVDGQSPEEALAYGLDSGLTRLEPRVREALGLSPG